MSSNELIIEQKCNTRGVNGVPPPLLQGRNLCKSKKPRIVDKSELIKKLNAQKLDGLTLNNENCEVLSTKAPEKSKIGETTVKKPLDYSPGSLRTPISCSDQSKQKAESKFKVFHDSDKTKKEETTKNTSNEPAGQKPTEEKQEFDFSPLTAIAAAASRKYVLNSTMSFRNPNDGSNDQKNKPPLAQILELAKKFGKKHEEEKRKSIGADGHGKNEKNDTEDQKKVDISSKIQKLNEENKKEDKKKEETDKKSAETKKKEEKNKIDKKKDEINNQKAKEETKKLETKKEDIKKELKKEEPKKELKKEEPKKELKKEEPKKDLKKEEPKKELKKEEPKKVESKKSEKITKLIDTKTPKQDDKNDKREFEICSEDTQKPLDSSIPDTKKGPEHKKSPRDEKKGKHLLTKKLTNEDIEDAMLKKADDQNTNSSPKNQKASSSPKRHLGGAIQIPKVFKFSFSPGKEQPTKIKKSIAAKIALFEKAENENTEMRPKIPESVKKEEKDDPITETAPKRFQHVKSATGDFQHFRATSPPLQNSKKHDSGEDTTASDAEERTKTLFSDQKEENEEESENEESDENVSNINQSDVRKRAKTLFEKISKENEQKHIASGTESETDGDNTETMSFQMNSTDPSPSPAPSSSESRNSNVISPKLPKKKAADADSGAQTDSETSEISKKRLETSPMKRNHSMDVIAPKKDPNVVEKPETVAKQRYGIASPTPSIDLHEIKERETKRKLSVSDLRKLFSNGDSDSSKTKTRSCKNSPIVGEQTNLKGFELKKVEKPIDLIEKPKEIDQKPKETDQKPKEIDQKPKEIDQKPKEIDQKPKLRKENQESSSSDDESSDENDDKIFDKDESNSSEEETEILQFEKQQKKLPELKKEEKPFVNEPKKFNPPQTHQKQSSVFTIQGYKSQIQLKNSEIDQKPTQNTFEIQGYKQKFQFNKEETEKPPSNPNQQYSGLYSFENNKILLANWDFVKSGSNLLHFHVTHILYLRDTQEPGNPIHMLFESEKFAHYRMFFKIKEYNVKTTEDFEIFDLFDAFVDMIQSAMKNEKNVILICCDNGKKCGPTVLVSYLLRDKRMQLKASVEMLKEKGCQIEIPKNFYEQLEDYEANLEDGN